MLLDTINQKQTRSDIVANPNKDYQLVTVAPYFRQKLNSLNKTELEKATQEVKEKAQKLAAQIGLVIEDIETIGGTYLGSSEITYQYKLKSADQEKIDLFASLMGDLSFEYQDATIAANYVTKDEWDKLPDENKAIEIVYKIPENTSIENIEKTLADAGIEGSSLNFRTNTLTITTFSEDETNEVINKLKDTEYDYKEHNAQNSRYLDNEYRRNAYQSWLNSKRGQQNRSLYNACSKALSIAEAAAEFPLAERRDGESEADFAKRAAEQDSRRITAANEAGKRWDEEFQKRKSQIPPSADVLPSETPSSRQPLRLPNGKEYGYVENGKIYLRA